MYCAVTDILGEAQVYVLVALEILEYPDYSEKQDLSYCIMLINGGRCGRR